MQSLKRFLISYWILCPLLALLLLVASLVDYPTLRQLDLPIYDRLVKLRESSPDRQVALLAIDHQSRAVLGETVGSRDTLTALLRKLSKLKVQQVGLLTPLSFPAKKTFSENLSQLEQELSKQQQKDLLSTLKRLKNQLNSDQALARQLKKIRPVLPLEQLATELPTPGSLSGKNSLALPSGLSEPQQLLLALQNPLTGYRFLRPEEVSFFPPAKNFQASQLPLGHLSFPLDPDGRIRSQLLLLPSRGQLVPALPLQAALQFKNSDLGSLQLPAGELPGFLRGDNWQIPIGTDYRLLLDLSGQELPFIRYSANELLAGKLDDKKLNEKIVLLGTTDAFGDRHQLATHGEISTSELAALATATLLADNPLQRPAWSWLVESLVLLYFAVLLLLLVPRLSFRAGLITLSMFLVTWLLLAATGLVFFGFWLQVVPATLLCLFGFTLVRWNLIQRETNLSQQESSRMLALSFQEQGLLDQALEKFLHIPPKDKAVKEMLYNLGLDFERKRMPHKALTAYRHLLQGGRFRDTRERIKQLTSHERTAVVSVNNEATLVLDRPGEKPTLGRYRIEKELGQGAMGTVYLGVDPRINRQVAIKTLAYQQVEPDQLQSVKERFFREAEAAGRLNHPQIVTIYDVGEENDLAYLAMELLKGKDLSHYCKAGQLLSIPRVIGVLAQVAGALDYAHQQGIVHRDIKPANIVVTKAGKIKVADFGIARMVSSSQTETGMVLGTPSYMSPEQVAGKKVDGRSDLFSLGVVMYELLSGEKPFQGESLTALMYNISNCNYRPLTEIRPKLPQACQAILGKLLLKGTSRRYKSAAVLAKELETLQQKWEKE